MWFQRTLFRFSLTTVVLECGGGRNPRTVYAIVLIRGTLHFVSSSANVICGDWRKRGQRVRLTEVAVTTVVTGISPLPLHAQSTIMACAPTGTISHFPLILVSITDIIQYLPDQTKM